MLRVLGIYNASGTSLGEVGFALGKIVGLAHCSLCDITHGWSTKEKEESVVCRRKLGVPFDLRHSNDHGTSYAGALPVVLAEMKDGSLVVLCDAQTLQDCNKDPHAMYSAIEKAIKERGLVV